MNFGFKKVLAVAVLASVVSGIRAADDFGKDYIECKIALPKGDLYMRGETDPVSDLVVTLSLTNKTAVEKKTKDSVTRTVASYVSDDVRRKLEGIGSDEKGISVDDYRKVL